MPIAAAAAPLPAAPTEEVSIEVSSSFTCLTSLTVTSRRIAGETEGKDDIQRLPRILWCWRQVKNYSGGEGFGAEPYINRCGDSYFAIFGKASNELRRPRSLWRHSQRSLKKIYPKKTPKRWRRLSKVLELWSNWSRQNGPLWFDYSARSTKRSGETTVRRQFTEV